MTQKPGLETPVLDFLLIAGCYGYEGSTLYAEAAIDVKRELDNWAYLRGKFPYTNTGRLERRFFESLASQPPEATLGDLKTLFKRAGPKAKNIGYRTLAHLNDVLHEHAIQPFRVRPYPNP